MQTITDIPTEILMKVVAHLPSEDKRTGLLICKNWYQVFRHDLYSHISLKNISQLQMLIDSLLLSQNNQRNLIPNGHFIKQLCIQDNKLSMLYVKDKTFNCKQGMIAKSIFEQLPVVCPNVEMLDFSPEIWKIARFHDNVRNWGNMRQLPTLSCMCTSFPYLQQFGKNLSTLSIYSNTLANISKKYTLTSILRMVPQVRKLIIKGGEKKTHSALSLTVQDIELIHQKLPYLESLEIIGDNIQLTLLGITGLDQIGNFPTVNNLEILKLDARLNTPAWAYYVAHKYPMLRELTLNIELGESNRDKFVEESIQAENLLFLHLAKTFHHLEVISLSCPNLEDWLNRSFFETLKKSNPSIRQVTPITRRKNQIKRDTGFTTALEFGKDLITALEIEQWRFDTRLPTTQHFLSCFTQLSYLNIVCDSYNSEYDMEKILDNCPLLETLVLEWGTMQVPNKQDGVLTKRKHPLKTLEITFIAFSPCFFEYLTDRCPSLTNMYIYKCKQICAMNDATSQTRLLVNMPNNRFNTIIMHGIRLEISSASMFIHGMSGYIRIASISTCKETSWYQHVGYKDNNRNSPFIEELETNEAPKVQSYLEKRQATHASKDRCEFLKLLNEQQLSDTLKKSLMFGYVKINCKSMENFSLDSYITCQ